ncbi:hypothetical protein ACKGJO_10435 [Gracilimonas sp. Q87]|uniref:hypothetical protein n=1 Tax=Gracilimonas sp. Q87 TaxID=3384766 RepID=UPI003983EE40
MKTKTMITTIKFSTPKVLKKNKEGNQLFVKFKNNNMIYDVIITRVGKNDFYYEDKGIFRRRFKSLRFMFWEYELPKSLKKDVQSLPVVKTKLNTYFNGMDDSISQMMTQYFKN